MTLEGKCPSGIARQRALLGRNESIWGVTQKLKLKESTMCSEEKRVKALGLSFAENGQVSSWRKRLKEEAWF